MAGEYLSAREAEKVRLPILNPLARIRKIQEYAGQLASDLPADSPLRSVRTRTSLVIAAQGRAVRDSIGESTENMREVAAALEEANRYMNTGVPDAEAQPTLFKIEGEEI